MVAGGSAYGFGMKGCQDGCNKNFNCNKSFNNNHKRGMLLSLNKSSNSMYILMSSISDLNLSKKQRSQIKKVMFNLREKNIKKITDNKAPTITFNKDGNFNKKDFIKNKEKLSKELIVLQADAIEEILNILNSEQKEIVIKKLSLFK